jgi:RecA-family ATPase
MSSSRRFLLSFAIVVAMTAAACGDPPDKEMQQAQAAVDAARAAGADRFAHEEFAAAEDALKRSHDAVAQRDYRLALNAALDARERAQTAAKQAADEKATARVAAERALAEADAALHESRAKLKAAESAHASAKVLAAARQAIADGETAVQEARTALGQGDYIAAAERSHKAAARLQGTARDLEAVPTTGTRRRH